jgi:hypothetical protein
MPFYNDALFQWGVLLGMIGAAFLATLVSFAIFDSEEKSEVPEPVAQQE